MTSFLVGIYFRSEDVPADRRAAILADERVRGTELMQRGAIERIWRLPGGSGSISVWAAADAEELHALLTSLPIAPWTRFDVTVLARHPLEAAVKGAS